MLSAEIKIGLILGVGLFILLRRLIPLNRKVGKRAFAGKLGRFPKNVHPSIKQFD